MVNCILFIGGFRVNSTLKNYKKKYNETGF